MSDKSFNSTRTILTEMKDKAEDIKRHLEQMFKYHVQKTILGDRISKRIKSKGIKNNRKYNADRKKILLLLEEQLHEVRFVLKDINSISTLMDFLVSTEQVSLKLENQKAGSDASSLIEPELTPLKKYSYDLDQIKILMDSFEVLRIELDRQRLLLMRENEFESISERVSTRYINEFSFQGSVNVQNLRSFSDTLNKRLLNHILSSHSSINAYDLETTKIIIEMKNIKLDPSVFFSPSLHDLIKRISKKRILEKGYEDIIFHMLIFLLSRVKKYYPHEYYRRIRLVLLVNDIAENIDLSETQTDITCAAIIIDSFSFFDNVNKSLGVEEKNIIQNYKTNAKKVLEEQIPRIGLLSESGAQGNWEEKAKELCLTAIQVDSAYRTAFNKSKTVSYADVSNYLKIDSDELRKISMEMVSRFEFLINPKGHFMSQYFLEPASKYKQKNYKASNTKKGKTRGKTGKKR